MSGIDWGAAAQGLSNGIGLGQRIMSPWMQRKEMALREQYNIEQEQRAYAREEERFQRDQQRKLQHAKGLQGFFGGGNQPKQGLAGKNELTSMGINPVTGREQYIAPNALLPAGKEQLASAAGLARENVSDPTMSAGSVSRMNSIMNADNMAQGMGGQAQGGQSRSGRRMPQSAEEILALQEMGLLPAIMKETMDYNQLMEGADQLSPEERKIYLASGLAGSKNPYMAMNSAALNPYKMRNYESQIENRGNQIENRDARTKNTVSNTEADNARADLGLGERGRANQTREAIARQRLSQGLMPTYSNSMSNEDGSKTTVRQKGSAPVQKGKAGASVRPFVFNIKGR